VAKAASLTWRSGETADLVEAIAFLRDRPVGSVSALNLEQTLQTRDVWGIDIDAVLAESGIRITGHASRMALASLCAATNEPQHDLSEVFEVPVAVAISEAEAASVGVRTTPGLPAEALILDIGGGTIDLVGENNGVSAAGAGELLSIAVAEVLDVPKGAADWIKRGPAQRLDSPQVLISEDGSHDFISANDAPPPANALGMLVTAGPAGFLPFGRNMQPAEWRIIRQSLKLEIIARNVSRILQTYRDINASGESFDIVIVGGPAEDDELLSVLGRMPEVRGLGRGNVAGSLGHRFAVAYGLTQYQRLIGWIKN
jgi:predicted RecA/RadA family phage recombinase